MALLESRGRNSYSFPRYQQNQLVDSSRSHSFVGSITVYTRPCKVISFWLYRTCFLTLSKINRDNSRHCYCKTSHVAGAFTEKISNHLTPYWVKIRTTNPFTAILWVRLQRASVGKAESCKLWWSPSFELSSVQCQGILNVYVLFKFQVIEGFDWRSK
jgi:hypothetical protein